MPGEETTPSREEIFIEKWGEFYVGMGQPRIAGRLLGWLLICDPPHQSAEDLAEATGASKASISNMIRLCMAGGLVERMGLPGERRTYYRVHEGAWTDLLMARFAKISELRQLADEGLEVLKGASEEMRERLTTMRDVHAFFEAEYPALIQRWDESQKE